MNKNDKPTERIGVEATQRKVDWMEGDSDKVDWEYRELIRDILRHGVDVTTRGHKCKRLVNECVAFTSTPLVSLRRTAWKSCLREWEWFMSGSCCLEDLHPSVQHWWKPWAKPRTFYVSGHKVTTDTHYVEHNYSKQFRHFVGMPIEDSDDFNSIDQIAYLIDGIKNHPYSRRNVITTWNTSDMASEDCPITNCHGSLIQAYVCPVTNKLSLDMVQRSADVICGVPHNWLQYWGFLLWLAHITGRDVGTLYWKGNDVHIYEQHLEIAERIANLAVEPIVTPELIRLPWITIGADDGSFKADHFKLSGDYTPILTDKVEMVV